MWRQSEKGRVIRSTASWHNLCPLCLPLAVPVAMGMARARGSRGLRTPGWAVLPSLGLCRAPAPPLLSSDPGWAAAASIPSREPQIPSCPGQTLCPDFPLPANLATHHGLCAARPVGL